MLTFVAASQPIVQSGLTAEDGIRAGVILAVTLLLTLMVRRIATKAFGHVGDGFVARIVGRALGYVVFLAGFVYALMAVNVQIGPLVGALGIGGIAIAFALQDILQNLVAGIILQARRPIRHGDQVMLGTHAGIVRDIDMRTVLIRTYDGLDVYVPNRTVLEGPLVNYTMTPNRRINVPVGVAYGTDLVQAQRLLVEAVRDIEGVLSDPEPAAWVTGFGGSSIDFAVLMWFPAVTHNLWKIQSDAAMAIKDALDRAGIEIPFPQQTLSLHPDLAQMVAPALPARVEGGSRGADTLGVDGDNGGHHERRAAGRLREGGPADGEARAGREDGPQSSRTSSLR